MCKKLTSRWPNVCTSGITIRSFRRASLIKNKTSSWLGNDKKKKNIVIKEVLRRRNERHNEGEVMKVVSDYLLGYRLQVPV